MIGSFTTDRLILSPLYLTDAEFVLELLNSPGFIEFIGDRQVRTIEDASGYIQKIIDNPDIWYWVVKLKNDGCAVGIITFIKRDYLDYHDIVIAFLPGYAKNGYAFEGANVILNRFLKDSDHPYVLAITALDNIHSIRLLEKLGMALEKEIQIEYKDLLLYRIST